MTTIVDDYNYKLQPFEHQKKALELSWNKDRFAYFMEMGCVDGATEYLTPKGWKKISEFNTKRPDKIAVVKVGRPGTTHTFKFELPEGFIKKEANTFISMKNKEVDFMHTMDHTMNFRNPGPTRYKVGTMEEVYNTVMNFKNKETKVYIPGVAKLEDNAGGAVMYDTDYILAYLHLNLSFVRSSPSKMIFKSADMSRIKAMRKLLRLISIDSKLNTTDVGHTLEADVRGKDINLFSKFIGISTSQLHNILKASSTLHPYIASRLAISTHNSLIPSLYTYGNKFNVFTTNKDALNFLQYAAICLGYKARIEKIKNPTTDDSLYRLAINTSDIEYDSVIRKRYLEVKEGGTCYCFRTSTGYILFRRNDKVYISCNSGKTKTIIDNAGMLFKKGAIDSLLIAAPNGVYSNWTNKEIPQHMADDIEVNICHWISTTGKKYKDDLMYKCKSNNPNVLDIFVVNIEALNSKTCMDFVNTFLKSHKATMGVVDESTCIKNHKAKRTKALIDIGDKCKVKRIATGSPVTNSPLDLYSQMRFLGKDTIPFGSFYAFRNTFAEIRNQEIGGGRVIPRITGYKNLDKLTELITPVSFRVAKKDCMDLPDKIYQTRYIELTDDQLKVYLSLRDKAMAVFNDKELTSRLAITTLMRLHQILCGCFTDDEGTTHSIPNNRLSELMETLDETQGKVIIFANYVSNIKDIVAAIAAKYGSKSVVDYYGATSYDDREKAKTSFEDPDSPVRFFVGNTQTAGKGITLVQASTVIYYSNDYSLENRQQSEDRAHRFGQKSNVLYIDFIVKGTLDEKILKSLINKRDIAGKILEDDLEDWIKLER